VALPPLIKYDSEHEYKEHFEREYCRSAIYTFDGIRVYFKAFKFGHAFYESSQRNGVKDTFSEERSQRIDWIKATLGNAHADLYQGYIKQDKSYTPERRVQVVYENFVVVIAFSQTKSGKLKGNFITCYQADNSIQSIRTSPRWLLDDCMKKLEEKNER